MIDIRIVCTHDAVKFAEMLMRLLEAEQHHVRLHAGRQSLADLEAAKASLDTVVLIWSANAPSQHYMREWARSIPPARLIELARAPGWPQSERKAPVIDAIAWRGNRSARAWNSMNERLRTIARAHDTPPKQGPKRAAMALGIASIAAVGGAAVVHVQETARPAIAEAPDSTEQTFTTVEADIGDPLDSTEQAFTSAASDSVGIGGPLTSAPEPPSAEDLEHPEQRAAPLAAMSLNSIEIPEYVAPALRPPTLIERLSALNPLRDISLSDDEEDGS
jgi:hypothetical protein